MILHATNFSPWWTAHYNREWDDLIRYLFRGLCFVLVLWEWEAIFWFVTLTMFACTCTCRIYNLCSVIFMPIHMAVHCCKSVQCTIVHAWLLIFVVCLTIRWDLLHQFGIILKGLVGKLPNVNFNTEISAFMDSSVCKFISYHYMYVLLHKDEKFRSKEISNSTYW